MSFENDVQRMEEITGKLRNNGTTLDEAITLFEEGVKIAARVESGLSKIERKVEILLTPPDSSDEARLAPFEPMEKP